jgi:predicted kinase
MSTIYLYRGLPGSGKSTAAKKLGCFNIEADQFFVTEGQYKWSGDRVSRAHKWCFDVASIAVSNRMDVVVSNTFTALWEMENYIKLAKDNGYDVKVVRCTGNYGNTHGVPEETLTRMKDRFEDYEGETII